MNSPSPLRVPRDDAGSALVLALIVVLVVGAGVAAALSYTGLGLTVAPAARDMRNESNYVQGAVEGAINQIRHSSEAGRPPGDAVLSCPSFSPEKPGNGLSGVDGSKLFTVSCTGLSDSAATTSDAPRYAIHALGAKGIRHTGTQELYVTGPVYSNGPVIVEKNSGSLVVNGTLTAEGTCSGDIKATDKLALNCDAADHVLGNDPRYKSAIDGASPFRLSNVVAQGVNGPVKCLDVVEFSPGYYNRKPSDLVPPKCNKAAWNFLPGRYYFDYKGVWDIGPIKVVGGTLTTGWTAAKSLGGACDDSAPGVQWAFGGAAQVFTKTAAGDPVVGGIELCGPPAGHTWHGQPQRIVLYGMSGHNDLAAGTGGTALLTPAGTPVPSTDSDELGTAGFDVPEDGASIDDKSATTSLTNKRSTASLKHPALASDEVIPLGTTITKVELVSAHETGKSGTVEVRLESATMLPITEVLDKCDSGCSRDITGLFPLAMRTPANFATLRAEHIIRRIGNGGSASLDGLRLLVTYGTPGLTAQSCVNGDPCYFFESVNNPNVFMHGTVYTPEARWKVTVHNSGETIFDRGVVLKDLDVNVNASSKQETSPFRLPTGTSAGRLVLFEGKVDGVVKVRACARYTDHVVIDGKQSAYAGWKVAIPHWQVLRTPSEQAAACP